MRTLMLGMILLTGVALAGCTGTRGGVPTAPAPASTDGSSSAGGTNAFAGTWTSSMPVTSGACSTITYSVTPTSTTTATLTYTATCAGVSVQGNGTGTLNGDSTMTWTSTGRAGACSYALGGSAIPQGASDLKITYSGTVCGAPVSGSDVLHR